MDALGDQIIAAKDGGGRLGQGEKVIERVDARRGTERRGAVVQILRAEQPGLLHGAAIPLAPALDRGEARIRGDTGDAAVIEVVQVLDGAGDGCRVVRLDGGPDVLPDTVKHHKGGVELVGRRVKLEAFGQNNALDPDGGAVIQVV